MVGCEKLTDRPAAITILWSEENRTPPNKNHHEPSETRESFGKRRYRCDSQNGDWWLESIQGTGNLEVACDLEGELVLYKYKDNLSGSTCTQHPHIQQMTKIFKILNTKISKKKKVTKIHTNLACGERNG